MNNFFAELFQYNHHSNERLIRLFEEKEQQVSEKSLQMLCHILHVHQVWNSKFFPGQAPAEPWGRIAVATMEEFNDANFEQSMQVLATYPLDELFRYTTLSGVAFEHRVRDLLFQIIHHSNYHRAQIATELRKAGIEPIPTDYILYKMNNG